MSVGKRLKKERERLGLNQTQMGVIGNVKKQSQLKYENDVTSPTANYLIEVAKIGVNVHYVLFGAKADNALTEDEQQLLAAFRAAPPVMRQFMLSGMNSASPSMKIQGDGNKQRKSDVTGMMEIVGDNNVQIDGKSRKGK